MRFLRIGPILALVIAGSIALAGCGDKAESPALSSAEVTPDLTGADPRLVKLNEEADELLPGGKPAFQRRLRDLRGLPVVANKWASWCDPCRDEAPIFQRVATDYANRVAFLGVNVADPVDDSEKFRSKYPMPFPSYADPNLKIAALIPPSDRQPITAFYDAAGRQTHMSYGAYEDAASLIRDIKRYAGPIYGPTTR